MTAWKVFLRNGETIHQENFNHVETREYDYAIKERGIEVDRKTEFRPVDVHHLPFQRTLLIIPRSQVARIELVEWIPKEDI